MNVYLKYNTFLSLSLSLFFMASIFISSKREKSRAAQVIHLSRHMVSLQVSRLTRFTSETALTSNIIKRLQQATT